MPENAAELNLSQRYLRPKIVRFLTARNWPSYIIKNYLRGYCNGMATLMIYSEFLESLHPRPLAERVRKPNRLELVLQKLAAWDGELSSLSPADQLEMAQVFTLCEYIQHISARMPCSQGDLHEFFLGKDNQKPSLEFSIGGLFKAEDFFKPITLASGLTTSLFAQLFQYSHRLILVSSGGHTVGLFRDGDSISYFSANHKKGKRVIPITDSLALVRAIFKSNRFSTQLPAPLGFRVFTYDAPQPYAHSAALLAALEVPLIAKNRHHRSYAALYLAARIGSQECVNFYLERGAKIHKKRRGRSALRIAANKGRVDIVKSMLLHGSYNEEVLIEVLRLLKNDEQRISLLNALALEAPTGEPLQQDEKRAQLFKHRSCPASYGRFFKEGKEELTVSPRPNYTPK